MISLSGYKITEEVFQGRHSLIYRAAREKDNLPVILKLLRKEYPTPEELGRFKREYELTHNLKARGSIRAYELEKYRNSLIIIEEDIGGGSLADKLVGHAPDITELLALAVNIADGMEQIHRENIIHMDVNPSNIIWNKDTGIVKLIDFGLSTQLSRENQQLVNPDILQGTLAYISPEQTGRMNRSIDYRSDLYSLGATLYELFAGRPPFRAADATELVHAHIARSPESPLKLNPEIPGVLSGIILKLLAKTAEERYQSAFGLKTDLEQCLEQYRKSGRIEISMIGEKDHSERFHISQKLYGRESEVTGLLNSFETVTAGSTEMVLVAGYSGVGKSSLIHEIHKPILSKRGQFISGKFDQFQRDIPYSVFIIAFQEFSNQLLGETAEGLADWKEKILGAVGVNGQVVIDVIPEIELIIGDQPSVPELGSAETQNRFILTFQNFVRILASGEHPLVVFLDDLQWADNASLNLLKALMTDPDSRFILFLGAYRDNEVNPAHPLIMTLNEIQAQKGHVETLELLPLAAGSLSQLLADTLFREEAAVRDLTGLIMEKTGGNPFFVSRFLVALYGDQLFQFDERLRAWTWDMQQIEDRGMTDNVIELMIEKIRKLPENTREILQICACIGNTFPLEILSVTSGLKLPLIVKTLWPALEEELLIALGDNHKFLFVLSNDDNTEGLNESFRFQHDRIQQAAYETIEVSHREALHLKIGRLLLEHSSAEEAGENVFNISAQLNAGRNLIHEKTERLKLAELNVMAAKKAVESSAYQSALDYARIGVELLPENCWREYYELSFELYNVCGDCEYANSNYEHSAALYQILIDNAKTKIEKAGILAIQLMQFAGRAMSQEGYDTGRKSLALCGIDFPEDKDVSAVISVKMENVKRLFQDREIKSLFYLPEMQDEVKVVALDNLVSIMTIAFVGGDVNIFAISVLLGLELILNHGQLDLAAQAYIWYSIFLLGQGKNTEAYEFGELAYEVSERYPLCVQKACVNNICGVVIFHWKEKFSYSIEVLKNGYKIGLERGDLLFAYSNTANIATIMLVKGEALQEVAEQMDYNLEVSYRNKFFSLTDGPQCQRNFVELMLHPDVPENFVECNYSPEQLERIKGNYHLTYYLHFQMQKEFWMGNYGKALELSRAAEKNLKLMPGFPVELENYFYQSLIIYQLLTEDSPRSPDEETLFKELETAEEKMAYWTKLCPENNLHRLRLMEAERARLRQEYSHALKLYEEAIQHAKANGFLHHEGLINELCACSLLERNLTRYAVTPMREARYNYQKWGAERKVQQLELKYPELLADISPDSRRPQLSGEEESGSISASGTERISEALDLSTVIKASQAISGEINLTQLLQRLMEIIIENAGAQKGYLVLKREERWLLEAEVNADAQARVMEGVPLEECNTVPESLIRFVTRSGKKVVIVDAAKNHDFSSDPYFVRVESRSVLCMALKREHRVEGVLYLENNSAPGAFKPENVSILKILLAQAIISIQNAYLFQGQKEAEAQVRTINAELEERVRDRTEELQVANKELETFSYSVSHDLRAPLRTIIGFINILREDHMQSLNKDILRYFQRIEHSSERMNELINDLLNLSKVNRHELEYRKFDAVALCRKIFDELEAGEPERKAEIHVEDNLEIDGDIKLVRIIFQNLLSNSWKYSAKKPETKIDVGRLTEHPEHPEAPVYFVRDYGAGFDMKHANTIFAAFKRVHSPKDFEGSGIGLATVERIVNRHGGEIWAEGKVGEGAIFYFTLGNT